ncbi:MAG: thiosulfate oxidation carrier protein SoxY [Rhodospirillales bacterium]|nr:MAG: thiosulfate oxidation carrier protein SoxY [Rhodospirillales bacterium]
MSKPIRLGRRELLLTGAAGLTVAALLGPGRKAWATPPEVDAALKKLTNNAQVKTGKVTLELPEVADDGRTVPLKVIVDSPMTDKDHVKAIHVFADSNPRPVVMSVKLGPRAGKAEFSIRIRLAQTQNVHAVAVMSDGQVYGGKKEVKVTAGGC